MKSRRLKKNVVYAIYGLVAVALIGVIYAIQSTTSTSTFEEKDDNYEYVSTTIFDDAITVNTEESIKIGKPYNDESVKVLKGYYDYKGEASSQEKSLIYYENTYMQSSGISYGKDDTFQVLSILDGEVTSVEEDDILGKIVQIKHDNNIISSYQSLSEVSVKVGDKVKQGDILGKSGKSNLEADLGNHLYFELVIKDANVNPEDYFDKSVNEI